MDFNDLRFNPEFKQDYVLTLNNGIGYKDNLACYCEKHRCDELRGSPIPATCSTFCRNLVCQVAKRHYLQGLSPLEVFVAKAQNHTPPFAPTCKTIWQGFGVQDLVLDIPNELGCRRRPIAPQEVFGWTLYFAILP